MGTRGAASQSQGEKVTPYRRTHLRLDTPDTFLVETPFARSWVLDQLATGPESRADNVHFLNSVGWELKPYQLQEHMIRERSETQGSVLKPVSDGGTLQVGAGFTLRAMFRKPSDLPGATTGSNANLVDQGDYFIERTVEAKATSNYWADQKLSADQTAFPGPSAEENVAMDRVAVSTSASHPEQALIWRFHVPGNGRQSPRVVSRVYFSGPAGYHKIRAKDSDTDAEARRTGLGQYCLTFFGDGLAELKERCSARTVAENADTQWHTVTGFRYAPSTQVSGRQHTVYIRPVKRRAVPGAWMIVFRCENTVAPTSNLGAMLAVFRSAQSDQLVFVYRVPTGGASVAAPIRVDNRRDQRPKFQASLPKYPPTGTLRCDPFTIPFWPTNSQPIRVIYIADVPTGTTLTVKCFDAATGAELSSVGSGPNYKDFGITFGQSLFYIEFTFTSATGDKSPVLYAARAQRNGRLETVAPTEVDLVPRESGSGLIQRTFGPVSILNVEGEPHEESGSTTVYDLTNGIEILKKRGDIPFILETEYDPNDDTKRSVLLEGYIRRPRRRRRGRGEQAARNTVTGGDVPDAGTSYLVGRPQTDGERMPVPPAVIPPPGTTKVLNPSYPSEEWAEIQLQLIGKWARLSEQFSNLRFNWHWPDPASPTGAPYKATDAVRYMLNWCGFDMSQLDIPDLPIRLWPTDNEMDLFVEPGAPTLEYIMKVLKDYLGAAIVWDGNAGTSGMIRLIRAVRPPYNPLARFILGPEADIAEADLPRLAHNLRAYQVAGELPNIPVLKYERQLIPPEGNAVLVTGVALGDWSSYQRLTQWAVNPVSFNFYNGSDTADPDHIDYLGRIVPVMIIDPGLTTPAAVNFATRRYYDEVCRGYYQDTVTAPLQLVNDATDTLQREDRKLRWYDPVTVAWESDKTWLVRSCGIDYSKDSIQLATYELKQPVGPYAD